MRRPIGLNELMIVNPGIGATNMFHDPMYGDGAFGRYGDPADIEELDGLGAIPMDELVRGHCANCGGEQIGYYDLPDRELIGHYCPTCGLADDADVDLDGYGWIGQEDDFGVDDEDYGAYGAYDDEYGAFEDDYGDYPDEPSPGTGYYGPYRDESMGAYVGEVDDELGRYVQDVPPPFNARCRRKETQLSGYEAESGVDPTCTIKAAVPTTPPSEVPDIFKPYL